MSRNHDQRFRPLRAGVSIHNTQLWELGTLGLMVRSAAGDHWLISCHHALWSPAWDEGAAAEEITQPGGGEVIAQTARNRSSPVLDIAAARIIDGQAVAHNEVLGIGSIGAPLAPTEGMRVLKSGAGTGVTEGLIQQVTGDEVVVIVPEGFTPTYELTAKGDSGAVWICAATRRPVAMHQRGNNGGAEYSRGLGIESVLAALDLEL